MNRNKKYHVQSLVQKAIVLGPKRAIMEQCLCTFPCIRWSEDDNIVESCPLSVSRMADGDPLVSTAPSSRLVPSYLAPFVYESLVGRLPPVTHPTSASVVKIKS